MSLTKVNEANAIEPTQALYYTVGSPGLLITEFSTTVKPEIAGNSIVNIGGALFRAVGSQPITVPGGLADGDIYIKCTPALDGLTAELEFTDTLPAFDEIKQGRYDGTALVLDRGMVFNRVADTFSDKWQMLYIGNATIKFRGSDNAIIASKITGAIYSS